MNIRPEPEDAIAPSPEYQSLETEGFSDPERASPIIVTEPLGALMP